MYRKGLEPKPSRGCATPSPALMRQMLTTFITALMAEADAVCGAEYGIRSEERTDSRNGYRERPSTPGPGRWMSPFRSCVRAPTYLRWLLQRWRRAEAAPTTVAATSYLLGVSARRMEKLVETLGITRLSKSQVSLMVQDLDTQVEAFRTRPLASSARSSQSSTTSGPSPATTSASCSSSNHEPPVSHQEPQNRRRTPSPTWRSAPNQPKDHAAAPMHHANGFDRPHQGPGIGECGAEAHRAGHSESLPSKLVGTPFRPEAENGSIRIPYK